MVSTFQPPPFPTSHPSLHGELLMSSNIQPPSLSPQNTSVISLLPGLWDLPRDILAHRCFVHLVYSWNESTFQTIFNSLVCLKIRSLSNVLLQNYLPHNPMREIRFSRTFLRPEGCRTHSDILHCHQAATHIRAGAQQQRYFNPLL